MSIDWLDPVGEMEKDKVIIQRFSSAETKAINDRINKKIQRADRVSRRNESIAVENASKAFVTF